MCRTVGRVLCRTSEDISCFLPYCSPPVLFTYNSYFYGIICRPLADVSFSLGMWGCVTSRILRTFDGSSCCVEIFFPDYIVLSWIPSCF